MKIAVFENEYLLIDTIFETVNIGYFNSDLTFEYFPASQSLEFKKIGEFDLIIIDIDLSRKSELDGYGLITKLETLDKHPPILILTGHSQIEENLKTRGLKDYPVLVKPIGLGDTTAALKPFYEKLKK